MSIYMIHIRRKGYRLFFHLANNIVAKREYTAVHLVADKEADAARSQHCNTQDYTKLQKKCNRIVFFERLLAGKVVNRS